MASSIYTWSTVIWPINGHKEPSSIKMPESRQNRIILKLYSFLLFLKKDENFHNTNMLEVWSRKFFYDLTKGFRHWVRCMKEKLPVFEALLMMYCSEHWNDCRSPGPHCGKNDLRRSVLGRLEAAEFWSPPESGMANPCPAQRCRHFYNRSVLANISMSTLNSKHVTTFLPCL